MIILTGILNFTSVTNHTEPCERH